MATDPPSFMENQRDETRNGIRASKPRFKRLWQYGLAMFVLLALFVFAVPGFINRTRLGNWILIHAISTQNLQFEYESMRIGWTTPIRLSGVRLRCKSSADRVWVDQIDGDFTLLGLLRRSSGSFGHWRLRGLQLRCSFTEGRCSLEEDFASFAQPSSPDRPVRVGQIEFDDLHLEMTEESTSKVWVLDHSYLQIQRRSDQVEAEFLARIGHAPDELGVVSGRYLKSNATSTAGMRVELLLNTAPLSLTNLLGDWFPGFDAAIPERVSGDVSGSVCITSDRGGKFRTVFDQIVVNDFSLVDPARQIRSWSNQRATLDGDVTYTRERILCDNVHLDCDFATLTLDAVVCGPPLVGGYAYPSETLLSLIDGNAKATIDFSLLQKSFPGVLSLADGSKLSSGKGTFKFETSRTGQSASGEPGSEQGRKCKLSLETDQIRVDKTRGGAVTIDPIDVTAMFSVEKGRVKNHQFRWSSSFAKGEFRRDQLNLDVDLRRASQLWSLLAQAPAMNLEGAVDAKLRWRAKADDSWGLAGSYSVSSLRLSPQGTKNQIRFPRLGGNIEVLGSRNANRPLGFSKAKLSLGGDELVVRAELTSPDQTGVLSLPWQIDAEGRIANVARLLSHWMPEKVRGLDGRMQANLCGNLSPTACRLEHASINFSQPRFAYGQYLIERQKMDVRFEGQWEWPTETLNVKSMTIDSDIFAVDVRGVADSNIVDMEINWKADLERFASAGGGQVGDPSFSMLEQSSRQPVVVLASAMRRSSDLHLRGNASGQIVLKGTGDSVAVSSHASALDFALLEPRKATAKVQTPSSIPLRAQGDRLIDREAPPVLGSATTKDSSLENLRVVWAEPRLTLEVSMRYARAARRMVVNQIQLNGQWLEAQLAGKARWDSDEGDIDLTGTTRIKLDGLARQLASVAKVPLRMEGVHESPLQLRLRRKADGPSRLAIATTLGWESGKFGCVEFGSASLPLRITNDSMTIAKSSIPVGDGKFILGGTLLYGPGPTVFRFQPGTAAESIQLTEKMTDGFMEFIAPPVHRVERIRGEIGLEIIRGTIVIRSLDQSHITGRLNIGHAEMSLTPMMRELKDAVAKLRSTTQGQSSADHEISEGKITVPKQTVDFDLDLGVANHRRVQFDIDGTTLASSGDVALDGKLAIIIEVPRHGDRFTGQPSRFQDRIASIPVTGSIYYPRIDPVGIGGSVTLLTRTAKHARDRLLRKQIQWEDEPVEGRSGDFEPREIGQLTPTPKKR